MAEGSAAPRLHPRIIPLVALVIGHATSDACVNFIPALWPEFQAKIGITNTQIGVVTGLVSFTTNFGQPLFGYLADRFRIPHMVTLGPAIVGLFIGLMALPNDVLTLGLLYMIAGVGTALFHPQGATLTGRASGSRKGLGMAVFSAGGSVGYGAGAIVGVLLFERFGWPGLFGATVLGGVTSALIFSVDPGARYPDTTTETMHLRTHVVPYLRQLGALFALVSLRSLVITVFNTFVPLGASEWGESTRTGAWLLSGMIVAGGVGNFAGGWASDHLGRRAVTVGSLVLCAPAFAASIHWGLPAAYVLLPIAGLLVQAAVSVNIVQGQELMPGAQSVASSLTMGAAWGVGGLALPIAGAAADSWGVLQMLAVTSWLPLLAAVLAFWVPERALAEADDTA
jgi:FSR family fosmidomycin resistance protein-like MFS transporter